MKKPHQITYESMGTTWEISIWDEIDPSQVAKIKKDVLKLTHAFDYTYSRFIPTSLVCKLATKKGVISVPEDFVRMLLHYQKIFLISQKKFTPLVGQALEEMGYDQNYSFKAQKKIHDIPYLDEAVEIIDSTHIKLGRPVLFDFGALGKGYFVDKLKEYLLAKKLKHFLVNGSGDIFYEGNGNSIQVGLEHPLDVKKVIGQVAMEMGAMCASANNRRSWGRHHHIIDPQTLKSNTEILATWVIANQATIADGLATVLFLVPPEMFQNEYDFEYLILNKAMKVKRSKGFAAQLY